MRGPMRPERSRDTGRAPRVARARLLVKADLAWVGGYPTGTTADAGVAWCVPPGAGRPAREIVMDRGSLHRATRALKELELRFGDVLDEALGDGREWMNGARAAVDLLKPYVHGATSTVPARRAALGSRIFRDDVVATVASAPEGLRGVLEASAWTALVAPARLGRIAAFARANRDAIEALRRGLGDENEKAEAVTLHLVLLADEEGPRRIAPLAHLLANRDLYEVPTLGVEYALALSRAPRGSRPARPVATLGRELAAFTTAILQAEPVARRAALALVEALELPSVVAAWAAWWARVASCERLTRSQPESDDDAVAREKARLLAGSAPRALRGATLTSLLRGAMAWDEATRRGAARALAELPAFEGGVAVRLLFLVHWTTLAERARGVLALLLRGFTHYLARTRSCGARRLLPWARILGDTKRPSWLDSPDGELLDDLPAAHWPTFYDALALAVESESDASDLAPLVRAILAVAPLQRDAARALDLARCVASNPGLRRTELRAVYELSGRDLALFSKGVAAVHERDAERGRLLRALEHVRRRAGDELAGALLLEEPDALVAFGRTLDALALVGNAPGVDDRRTSMTEPSWTSTYPAWMQASLRRLAESDARAERTARRLLGDDVRSVAAIRRELGHLESLVVTGAASDRMRRRSANLRARLESPRPLAPEQRAHLVAKVERAARRAKLAHLEGVLQGRMRSGLSALFELDELPPWLLMPRTLEQLAPIASFEPGMRTLALRVLRARAGSPPWDLRDDPANRAFLARLRRAGVDVDPWVDGLGPAYATTADGVTVTLQLEDDPLEVLDMGKHFATCLSPGAVNYFSTFANVADANKRVLFARDSAGKVVARCLLALTETGALVAFHPYAHDARLGFGAIVASFAGDLAARMGVFVAAHGDVPRVVAPDWYDDGPVDLGGRFPFLQDGAPFRRSIAHLTPAAFVEKGRLLFSPLPLGALTLPLLVALPELDARPELLEPLVPMLAATEGLPLATCARALDLLNGTPEATAASRALLPQLIAGLRRVGDDGRGWVDAAWRRVSDACPSDALRLLRDTRAPGVRSWADERDGRRLEMAARASEALRRPRAAIAIYRLAAERAWTPASRKALYTKAAALEASLGASSRARPRV